MEFGRLARIDDVDFTLPGDHPANAASFRRLREAGDEGPARVLLGSPRWGHDAYVGKIYPPGTRPPDYLRHYATQFPSVELNTTFYGVRPGTVAAWRDATPADFRFCPKVPKEITHDLRLREAEAATARFHEHLDAFGPRLGITWMLLPEGFGPESADALLRYVEAWPRHRPLAVELRNRRWFGDRRVLDAVFEVFEATGTTPVLTDVAGRRDVLHQRVTAPTVILRFAGNRLHPTDFTRIDAWVERLATWLAQGARTVYLFLHQPEEELNVELAEAFGQGFREHAGIEVQVPQRVTVYQQGSLF